MGKITSTKVHDNERTLQEAHLTLQTTRRAWRLAVTETSTAHLKHCVHIFRSIRDCPSPLLRCIVHVGGIVSWRTGPPRVGVLRQIKWRRISRTMECTVLSVGRLGGERRRRKLRVIHGHHGVVSLLQKTAHVHRIMEALRAKTKLSVWGEQTGLHGRR